MKKKILALAFSFMFILGISAVFIGCTPEKEYYTLTVNYNNDIDKQTELSVEKGTTIVSLGSSTALLMENSPIVVLPSSQNISSPHKLLVFDGWYTNSTFTEKFDTSKPIEEDTSIIAKWKLNEDYSFFQIASGSMQASGFNTGDIIICKNLTALDSVNVGDFILYNYSSLTVFHQVVEITLNDNSTLEYKTKGTSNDEANYYTITRDMIVGKYAEKITNPTQYLKYIGSI